MNNIGIKQFSDHGNIISGYDYIVITYKYDAKYEHIPHKHTNICIQPSQYIMRVKMYKKWIN